MCPECHQTLVVFELEGVEVDHCIHCLGTWLDAGELEKLLELAGVERGALSRALQKARDGEQTARRCPRCRKKLELVTLGGSTGEWGRADEAVELDRCPLGHGFWLDRGEVKAVIKSGGEEGVVSRFLSDLLKSEIDSDT